MRTNVVIDEELLREAMRLLDIHTKTGVVEEALRRAVVQEKRKEIRKLRGNVDWDADYDYKALR